MAINVIFKKQFQNQTNKNFMAKKKLSIDDAQDAANELLVKGESSEGVSWEDAWKVVEDAKTEMLSELTSEYFTPEEDSEYNLLFEGMGKATLEGKDVEVVNLRDKSGRKMINGNAVLVNSLKRCTVLPAFVRIVTRKKVKGGNGTYLDMSVFVLPSATK